MLGADEIADVHGDQIALYRLAGFDPSEPVSIAELALATVERPPRFVPLAQESKLNPIGFDGFSFEILIRVGTSPARARWLAAHEIAEWYYWRIGYEGADIEDRCNALGAALVAPAHAFSRAVRVLGHSFTRLADAFQTTHAVALLRIGEVTGRPVALLGPRPVTRGEEFAWPRPLRKCMPREAAHLVTLSDDSKVGAMAVWPAR